MSRIKVIVVGEVYVGKSSLVQQLHNREYFDDYIATIGSSFSSFELLVEDNVYNIQVWDTAGQEAFQSLAPMYYRGAQIALLVFDRTMYQDVYTSENLKKYIGLAKRYCDVNCKIILVANKSDLLGSFSHERKNIELDFLLQKYSL